MQVVTVLPATSTSVVTAETKNQNEGPGVSNWHLSVSYTDPSPTYQKFLTVMRAGGPFDPIPAALAVVRPTSLGEWTTSVSLLVLALAAGLGTAAVLVARESDAAESPRAE